MCVHRKTWKPAVSNEGALGSGMQGRANTALSQLLEMKSTDRKQTLLHYLVRVITEKYPELTGFHTELHFLDKAGTGSTCGHGDGGHGGAAPTWGPSEPALTLELVADRPPRSVPGRRVAGRAEPAAGHGAHPQGVHAAGRQPRAQGVPQGQHGADGEAASRQQNCQGGCWAPSPVWGCHGALSAHACAPWRAAASPQPPHLCLCSQEAYESAVEYFGENPKTSPPTTFFPMFMRFIRAYKVRGNGDVLFLGVGRGQSHK